MLLAQELESESILRARLVNEIGRSETTSKMRIFLRTLTEETDVQDAVRLLRAAAIFVGSGAVIREDGQPAYGSINLSREGQVELALEVLTKAGIKAST
jgi:hypothetical protein